MSADTGTPAVFLPHDKLDGLVAALRAAGTEVAGPARADGPASPAAAAAAAATAAARALEYRVVENGSELALGAGIPRLSLKGFYLPQNEALFSWRRQGTDVTIERAPTAAPVRAVLGAKPCDAAALAVLDHVMNWDCADDLWNGRRDATTVFTLACGVEDASCFCTAVGLAPDATRGADGLLTAVEGGWLVQPTTDKGASLVNAHAEYFDAVPPGAAEKAEEWRREARARVAANLEIDPEAVREWIATHFDDPLLATLGVRCNGCGACASVCPTCHCFDIIDEPEGVSCGTRRRCWDTCQSRKFTLHASGHNPRTDQNARFRQRLNHKFAIYPLRFGEVLCTGCGRCARQCHAGQDLVEILGAIDVTARRPAAGAEASAGSGATPASAAAPAETEG